eukprot:jgi/Bigna1/134626/aug1.26_g9334
MSEETSRKLITEGKILVIIIRAPAPTLLVAREIRSTVVVEALSARTMRALRRAYYIRKTVGMPPRATMSSASHSGSVEVEAQKAIDAGWDNSRVVTLTPKDSILYSLGIGAGENLKFSYERHPEFSVFPTLPCIWSFCGTMLERVVYDQSMPPELVKNPYLTPIPGFPAIEPYRFLDAERYVEIYNQLPPQGGTFRITSRHVNIMDKRIGTMVETEHIVSEISKEKAQEAAGDIASPGDLRVVTPPESAEDLKSRFCGDDPVFEGETILAKMLTGSFIRDLSGFESAGNPTGLLGVKIPRPERAADFEISEKTFSGQPTLYRLGSHDFNPLHIDPEIAQKAGLEGPIMHGLCTLGFAIKHALKLCAEDDPTKLKGFKIRFAAPVDPGSTLVTKMWKAEPTDGIIPALDDSTDAYTIEVRVMETDRVVINQAYVLFHR